MFREIYEHEVVPNTKEVKYAQLQEKPSARAVVFDDNGRIAILRIQKRAHYALPGGTVEFGETDIDAIHREVREEAGCEIEILHDIGIVVEYRVRKGIKKTSHGFLCNVRGAKGKPMFTQSEKERGFELIWVEPEYAFQLFDSCVPNKYTGWFVVARDRLFLEEAMKIVNSQ